MHPSYLIDKQVKCFLHNKFSTNNSNAVEEFKTALCYMLPYMLPYIGSFSNNTKKKIKELCQKFC